MQLCNCRFATEISLGVGIWRSFRPLAASKDEADGEPVDYGFG